MIALCTPACVSKHDITESSRTPVKMDVQIEEFFWPPPDDSFHPRTNRAPFPWPPHEQHPVDNQLFAPRIHDNIES